MKPSKRKFNNYERDVFTNGIFSFLYYNYYAEGTTGRDGLAKALKEVRTLLVKPCEAK